MSDSEIIGRFRQNPTDEMINILAQLNACDSNQITAIIGRAGFKRKNNKSRSWELSPDLAKLNTTFAYPDLELKSKARFVSRKSVESNKNPLWIKPKEESMEEKKVSAKLKNVKTNKKRNSKFTNISEETKQKAYDFYVAGHSYKQVAKEFGLSEYCTRRLCLEFKANDPDFNKKRYEFKNAEKSVEKEKPKHLASELNLEESANFKIDSSVNDKKPTKTYTIDFSHLKNDGDFWYNAVKLFTETLDQEIENTKKRLELLYQLRGIIKVEE